MERYWTEDRIREEIRRLDGITGLNGAAFPIRFTDAKNRLASWNSKKKGDRFFEFSTYYYDDPFWPRAAAIDTIRHEYAHYMDEELNPPGKMHGKGWKECCARIGAEPKASYSYDCAWAVEQRANWQKHLSAELDRYKTGDRFRHPRFGPGTIVEIHGEGIERFTFVKYDSGAYKPLSLFLIYRDCKPLKD